MTSRLTFVGLYPAFRTAEASGGKVGVRFGPRGGRTTGRRQMTWARRSGWGLVVLMLFAVHATWAVDGEEGGSGESRNGRAITRETVTSTSDLTGHWEGTWESIRFSVGARCRVF